MILILFFIKFFYDFSKNFIIFILFEMHNMVTEVHPVCFLIKLAVKVSNNAMQVHIYKYFPTLIKTNSRHLYKYLMGINLQTDITGK